jgi:hypothetical protein
LCSIINNPLRGFFSVSLSLSLCFSFAVLSAFPFSFALIASISTGTSFLACLASQVAKVLELLSP